MVTLTLAKTRKVRHAGIKTFIDRALNPKQYCEKWIPRYHDIHPGEHGYRQLCIKELARVTGYSPTYIKNWGSDYGKTPRVVKRILGMADMLNSQSTDWSKLQDEWSSFDDDTQ